jgi:hypothetical protein
MRSSFGKMVTGFRIHAKPATAQWDEHPTQPGLDLYHPGPDHPPNWDDTGKKWECQPFFVKKPVILSKLREC